MKEDQKNPDRREVFKQVGKVAVAVPAVTLLLSVSEVPVAYALPYGPPS